MIIGDKKWEDPILAVDKPAPLFTCTWLSDRQGEETARSKRSFVT